MTRAFVEWIWMREPNLPKTESSRPSRTAKCSGLILDLRRNGGGAEETLLRLIGNLFDRDITVGGIKRRKESKLLVAKTRGDGGFKGQLVVLIDSGSSSASEVLARVIQLEKRGTILGDRSSGKVMRSRLYPHQIGLDTVIFYGVSVTDADVIMSDGKSLEGVGVSPDEVLLPTRRRAECSKRSVAFTCCGNRRRNLGSCRSRETFSLQVEAVRSRML